MELAHIPLNVLVIDANASVTSLLVAALEANNRVEVVDQAHSLEEAQTSIRSDEYNTVFIDPFALGLAKSSEFVFSLRKALPEIVFVLFLKKSAVESDPQTFFAGERRRFAHYYTLDKQTPLAAFPDELDAIVRLCESDLSWRLSKEGLRRLQTRISAADQGDARLRADLVGALDNAISAVEASKVRHSSGRSVFVSHRFAEAEYVDGLVELLKQQGFEVQTGSSANTYVSQAILQRIEDCEFFVCLMTKAKEKVDGTFTTSPWLLEEKGAALALGKRIVLLIEEGVDDFGGLQGDWQRIHFGQKGFLKAALDAVGQLKSYIGTAGG